jgi:hypothetical protein
MRKSFTIGTLPEMCRSLQKMCPRMQNDEQGSTYALIQIRYIMKNQILTIVFS